MLLTKIAILIVLLMVFVQDIRSRSVYWVLFPCLVILFISLGWLQHRAYIDTWQAVLMNIGFLILQFLLVSAYFSIKSSCWINITKDRLGWGDLLLLLTVAFYLSFFNFLLFYITSLVAVLLCWLAWQALSSIKDKHIPLAGLQAFVLGLFLITGWWIKPVNLTSDNWLLSFITK